jgi:LDH2 family malate/lactate/ureidoglycolate dehydrogenase
MPHTRLTSAPTDRIRIRPEILRDFLTRIFMAAGCDADNARLNAEGVLAADLAGHHIQGIDHIYSTVRELRAGRLNGRAQPRVTRETTATARVDGDGGTGHVTGVFATEVAMRKVRAAGIGAVGLVGGGDIFMLGYYVERMAHAGLVGMTFTNTHPVRVHPTGGIDRVLGTNPLAFAFPVFGGEPVVVDLATSTSAIGHVRIASYADAPIAEGIAIDRDGQPTTSAQAALDGSLTPLGGHKGFALGLAVGLISGPLIGAAIGEELQAALAAGEGERRRGHLFIAIDPAAFGEAELSAQRVAVFVGEIKGSRKAVGVSEILIPGERSRRRRDEALRNGVPILRSVWSNTLKIAQELGVTAPEIDE